MSRPLQIYLEDNELMILEQWALKRGGTKSQAVRVALCALTWIPEEDPLLSASGMVDGLPKDLSCSIGSYFEETFIVERRSRHRKTNREAWRIREHQRVDRTFLQARPESQGGG